MIADIIDSIPEYRIYAGSIRQGKLNGLSTKPLNNFEVSFKVKIRGNTNTPGFPIVPWISFGTTVNSH